MDFGRDVPVPRRAALSRTGTMHDQPSATNSKTTKGLDEPDTCRICRGEGSDEEQLFYPCKCSGSIKFVHQNCLMEWLSHSQKKYCELCKTPFRFTKLYDPNMPEDLPTPVFFKELLFHIGRSLLTWLRFFLVAFIWLGWLPWSMRAVWRGLFWLADGRWPSPEFSQEPARTAVSATVKLFPAHSTSPATPVLSPGAPTLPSITQNLPSGLPQFLFPVSSILNFTAGEPLIYSIAKRLLANAVVLTSNSSPTTKLDSANATGLAARRLRQPSWLSDVSFLNKLTPYPTINNILIDTLEGQLITLLVVILFIHVFLIREWVVQQQPAINLAEGEPEEAAQLLGENRARADEGHQENAEREREGGQEEGQEDREPPDTELPPPTPFRDEDWVNLPPDRPQRPNDSLDSGQPSQGYGADFAGPSSAMQHSKNSNLDFFPRGSFESSGNPGSLASDVGRNSMENLTGEPGPLRRLQTENWSGFGGFEDEPPTANHPSTSPFHTSGRGKEPERETDSEAFDGPTPTREEEANTAHPPDPIFKDYATQRRTDIPSFNNADTFRSSSGAPVSFPPFSNIDSLTVSGRFEFGAQSPPAPHNLPGELNRDGDQPIAPPLIPEPEAPEQSSNRQLEPLEPLRTANDSNVPRQDPADSETGQSADGRHTLGQQPRVGLVERITDWFWGGVPLEQNEEDDQGNDDEHVVDDPAQEPPFVPMRHGQLLLDGNGEPAGGQAGENHHPALVADDGADANDADAVEDGDDLEGIMELIGMHGAIFGLLQNGVISALLISFTVTVGIWLPYLWGKMALVLLTNPVRLFIGVPLALLSIAGNIAADTIIGSFAYLVYCGNVVLRALLGQIGRFIPSIARFSTSNAVTYASLSVIDGSGQRLKRIATTFFSFHESDLPMFSVLSHQALRIHQARLSSFVEITLKVGKAVFYDIPLHILEQETPDALIKSLSFKPPMEILNAMVAALKDLGNALSVVAMYGDVSNLTISDDQPSPAAEYELANWDTKDRIIAIVVGYCFASLIGLAYLRLSSALSGSPRGQRVEGAVAEVLNQAGGVMKVILIIGIEMIVFPLYCGILLDIALLPLFEHATLSARMTFSLESRFTSLFVHWFIGTCYMFHFALFVSMCRKIMRNGVLYFIRDPDDPTFHPVRDVLERSVATQLRKIGFSALVYGALVIVCLGGVVWGLFYAFRGVLPIHWSCNEPVLEFPADLLFYNFVMPLAIRSIKPSDILHTLYDWWFHKCARFLRLSDFLFGERQSDEEGHHAYKTWRSMLTGVTFQGTSDSKHNGETRNSPVSFVRDGKFVRAPASDQARIPKDTAVFLEVNENNERVDGNPDRDDGLHGKKNEMFTKIYIPPWFRTRISAFIFLIWAFSAATGVSATVIPLVLGRKLMSLLFPAHIRVNDIYAFSVGIYISGGLGYGALHAHEWLMSARTQAEGRRVSPKLALDQAATVLYRIAKSAYALGGFAILFPSIFAFIMEFYLLIPIHAYFDQHQIHTIHLVQDWTIGVLYVRMVARFMLNNPTSRPAVLCNAVHRNGWLNPDVKLATRAFFIPAILFALFAGLAPITVGFLLNSTIFRGESATMHSQVYRYAYPGFLVVVLLIWGLHSLRNQIATWRTAIRDDVYLIGERLHNLGEKKARNVGSTRRMMAS